MSKLWIFVKTNMRANAQQFVTIFIMYIALPLFFSLLMGFSFSSAFVPDESSEPIEVALSNQDQGEYGQLLEDTLRSEGMQAFINVKEDKDATDFIITIEEGYSTQLEDTLVSIELKNNASQSEGSILKQIIHEYQNNLVKQLSLSEQIKSIEDQPDQVIQLQEGLERVSTLNTEELFAKVKYHSDTALTSNQFTSVGGLVYIFLMALASTVGMKTKAEMKGLQKRINILPLTPFEDTVFSIVSDSLLYLIIGAIYIGIWRLIDSSTFIGNPLFYLGWLVVYVITIQVINNFMYYVIPDKFINIFYQIIMMIFMLFGFLPLDQILGNELSEFFSNSVFRKVFNQPMYDYILNREWNEHLMLGLGLLVINVIAIACLVLWRERKELRPS